MAEIIKVHFFSLFLLQKCNKILSAFAFLQRQPEDSKLNPTSRDKLRYAKLATEVKPELRSLDPVYPCVIILTYFSPFLELRNFYNNSIFKAQFFRPYYLEKVNRGAQKGS